MSTYSYKVVATCRAIVTETWRISSERALDEDEIRASLSGDVADDVTLECVDEETSDEEDRQIEDIDDQSEV